jgi:hypothetical protein
MRDFLKGLELDKETIDTIMAEHGKLVTADKEKITVLQEDLKTKENLIETANKEIESYKSLDIETIKKNADDYKSKFEEAESNYKKELSKRDYIDAIKESFSVNGIEFSSEYAKKGIMDDLLSKELKYDNGKLLGVEDAIKELQTQQPKAFVIKDEKDETPPPMYSGAGKAPITPTEADIIKQSYDKAKENKNTTEMARLTRVAQEKGVKII